MFYFVDKVPQCWIILPRAIALMLRVFYPDLRILHRNNLLIGSHKFVYILVPAEYFSKSHNFIPYVGVR